MCGGSVRGGAAAPACRHHEAFWRGGTRGKAKSVGHAEWAIVTIDSSGPIEINFASRLNIVRAQFEGKPYAEIDSNIRMYKAYYAVCSSCGIKTEQKPSAKPAIRY